MRSPLPLGLRERACQQPCCVRLGVNNCFPVAIFASARNKGESQHQHVAVTCSTEFPEGHTVPLPLRDRIECAYGTLVGRGGPSDSERRAGFFIRRFPRSHRPTSSVQCVALPVSCVVVWRTVPAVGCRFRRQVETLSTRGLRSAGSAPIRQRVENCRSSGRAWMWFLRPVWLFW